GRAGSRHRQGGVGPLAVAAGALQRLPGAARAAPAPAPGRRLGLGGGRLVRSGVGGARSAPGLLGQGRGLALGAFGGDDDRVREALGPGVLAQDLVGAGAAGALERDALQLLLQLLLGEPPALEPGARLRDLLDVEIEDVAPP